MSRGVHRFLVEPDVLAVHGEEKREIGVRIERFV